MISFLKYLIISVFFIICVGESLNAQNVFSDYNPTLLIKNGLMAPGRMAVDTDDNVYVTDAIQKNIVKYDSQGNYIATITTTLSPLSIAINNKNQLFVGDETTGSIYNVSENGNKTLFYEGTSMPNSMVFGLNNTLYILDSQLKKVIGLDVSGTVVKEFTYNTFTFPTGIAFDKQNNHIIVSEHGGIGEDVQTCGGGSMSWGTTGPLTTIYIFDIDGNLIKNFGCFGTKDGLFHRIQGVTVGTCGNIYAVDSYLGRVNVFDANGNYITKFGTQGDGLGQFNLPMGIVFTSDNRLFVSSMNKGAIDVFRITSTLPTSTITSSDQVICAGTSTDVTIAFTGTAPWTFTYTLNSLNPQIKTATESPYVLPVSEEGLYEITALSDGNNAIGKCFTGSANIQVSTAPPTATIITPTLSKCNDDSTGVEIQFTGIAPFTFTYTIDGLNPTEITATKNNYFINAQGSGLYEITSLSDAGCTGTSFIGNSSVTIHPIPTAIITNGNGRIVINAGKSANLNIAFTGTAPYTFVYTRDELSPISVTTNENPYILTVSEEGTYEVEEIMDAYCSSNISEGYPEIVINDTPEPAIASIETGIKNICKGDTAIILVNLSGTAPWTFFYTVNGLNPTEITTLNSIYELSALTPGVYELKAVSDANNSNGSFSGTATVNEFASPIINLPENLSLCSGNSTDLNPGKFISYLWNDGSTNEFLTVNASGTYSVTVTDQNGCTASATTEVVVNPLPIVDLGPEINMCEGDSASKLDAGIFNTYLWSDGSTNRFLEVSASGSYSVTVTNTEGCSNTSSVTVKAHSLPSSDFFYNIKNSDVQFISDVTNVDRQYWDFGDGNSSTEENPIHTYAKKGTYTATYTASSNYCGENQSSETFKVGGDESANLIAIYPNPSFGEFTLKISPVSPITSDISIIIKSLSGQTIYREVLNPMNEMTYGGSIYKKINLSNFVGGIYLINVNAGNFTAQEKLILKN